MPTVLERQKISMVHEEIKQYTCECCGNEYSGLYHLMIHKKSVQDDRTLQAGI